MMTLLKRKNPFLGYSNLSGTGKIGFLIGFLLIENNISGLPSVGSFYYVIMFMAFIYLQSREPISIGSKAMVGFYIACALSIMANNVPSFFSPWERLFTFILITALVSPLLISDTLVEFRVQTFMTIMRLLQLVVIVSFVYALAGLGYTHLYFQGITNHSMMLGPFSALCALYTVCRLIKTWNNKPERLWNGGVLLCSLFCVLQAGSRTSFIGTLFAMSVFFAVYYHNALGKYLKMIIVVIIALMCSYPIWGKYMDKLEQKNVGRTTELNINSREDHWKQRLVEFESSPVVGIGFCSIDVSDSSVGSTFDINGGKVETGSSWLSILSMTGIIGFTFFFVIYMTAIRKAWALREKFPLLSGLLIAILCFWTCHMMAEGYILAGGNTLAFCAWLTFGVIYGISRDEDYAISIQHELAG